MRASEFIVEYKNYPAEDYHGLSFTMKEEDGILLVKALNDYGMPIGYVEFIMDGDELDPQDLWVDEDSRGIGVAKVMYDYIKSRGFEIHRSWDQTDAGAGFWNKHRGEDVRVWENFADGKKPGRKGLAKRSGVDCKQSVSKLRSIAKNSSGEKQRMAHWCANMKSGKK